ncbi:MAG: flagellar basal body rod protein FlgB [Treponema sp.]|jgi:flagellar basal-body rod protein FlgB|nr:flagellar basal body rod protein FlgB [Treponema sp.]
MGMNNFFDSVDLLHRALDVQNLRYQVSANNIAMSEVPNYKKQYVNFESELKRAFDSQNIQSDFHMNATLPGHFTSEPARDWHDVEPRRVTDWATTANANGNNVDAEQEAMTIAQIQMQYQLLTRLENFQFSQVDIAMKKI